MNGLNIHIHFGAHKTATTFIQQALKSNRQRLRGEGIGYLPLNVSRQIFFPDLIKIARASELTRRERIIERLRSKVLEAVRASDTALPVLHTLVLSDENFAGALAELRRPGGLYPNIVDRLKVLDSVLDGGRISYFFGIRDYADFIPSAYCELLRNANIAVPSFADFLAEVSRDDLSWPALFARLRKEFPQRPIYFWRYEDFPESAPAIMRAISATGLGTLDNAESNVRPSLTVKGIAILHACGTLLTKNEFRHLANILAEKFRFEDSGGKLRITDPATAEEFRNRYREHSALLSRQSDALDSGMKRLHR